VQADGAQRALFLVISGSNINKLTGQSS
jgi:hypothetical protein